MLENGKYDEEGIVNNLYGDLAHGMARFEAACDYVAHLVISTLASKDPDSQFQIPFIRKAIHKGIPKLAQKTLARAMDKAWREEEFEQLLILQQENLRLQKESGRDANAKGKIPRRREIFGIIHHLQCVEDAMEGFQKIKWVQSAHVEKFIASLQAPLQEFSIRSEREKVARLRLEMRFAMIRGQHVEACRLQSEVTDLLYASQVPRLQRKRIAESGLHIRLLHAIGEIEDAGLECLRLQTLPAHSESDMAMKIRFKLSSDFCMAMTTGRRALGWDASKLLLEEQDRLPKDKIAKLYHYASLFMAMEGQWGEVSRWSHLVLSLPGKQRVLMTWPSLLMLSLAAIEMGDPESASTYLNRLKRQAKRCEQAYPSVAARGLARLINVPANESRLLLLSFKKELQKLCSDEKESLASSFFNLSTWIEARISGRPLSQVLEQTQFESLKRLFSATSAG